ncbi:hypothetical protein D3C84_948360 [compost metagenome]
MTLCALPTATAALWATSWEVADIWFMAVATCSIWLRWSLTAWLLSPDTSLTRPAWRSTSVTAWPTCSISSWILATVALNAWPNSPSSSRERICTLTVMSPSATRSSVCARLRSAPRVARKNPP